MLMREECVSVVQSIGFSCCVCAVMSAGQAAQQAQLCIIHVPLLE